MEYVYICDWLNKLNEYANFLDEKLNFSAFKTYYGSKNRIDEQQRQYDLSKKVTFCNIL